MGSTVMAKRKATKPKPAAERKAIAVTIKGDPAWKAWLDGLADHCRSDVAKVIDKALIGYAKSEGYDQEAPRR
jgi:hypothetical protein